MPVSGEISWYKEKVSKNTKKNYFFSAIFFAISLSGRYTIPISD